VKVRLLLRTPPSGETEAQAESSSVASAKQRSWIPCLGDAFEECACGAFPEKPASGSTRAFAYRPGLTFLFAAQFISERAEPIVKTKVHRNLLTKEKVVPAATPRKKSAAWDAAWRKPPSIVPRQKSNQDSS
jgi:hypothetical protein